MSRLPRSQEYLKTGFTAEAASAADSQSDAEENEAPGKAPDQAPESTDDPQPVPAEDAGADDQRKVSLERASGHQQAVIESLDGLLSELSEWRQRRNLNSEIGGLIRKEGPSSLLLNQV